MTNTNINVNNSASLLGDQISGQYNVSGVFEEIENLIPPETNLYDPNNDFINIVPPGQPDQPSATVIDPGVEFKTRALEETSVDFTENGFSIEIVPNPDEEFVEELFLELGLEPQPAVGTKTLDQAFQFSDLDFIDSSDSISEVVLLESNFPELDLDWTEDNINVSFPGVVLTEEGFSASFEIVTQNDQESLYSEVTVQELDNVRQIFGGSEDDELLASNNEQLFGGNGDDLLGIRQGGNNLLYGASGADIFEIANGQLPDAVEFQYLEDIELFLPDSLSFPDLIDTGNRIADFELGVDKIQITGLEEIASSFDDLELLPVFGDLGSTSITATFTENGSEQGIYLADISGVTPTQLSSNDFIFA